MATFAVFEPAVERLYAPEELRPGAPRLYVRRNDNDWELLDEEGILLSTHPSQGDAVDAACARSQVRFSEILVRGSTGRIEWRVDQGKAYYRGAWRKLTRSTSAEPSSRTSSQLE